MHVLVIGSFSIDIKVNVVSFYSYAFNISTRLLVIEGSTAVSKVFGVWLPLSDIIIII